MIWHLCWQAANDVVWYPYLMLEAPNGNQNKRLEGFRFPVWRTINCFDTIKVKMGPEAKPAEDHWPNRQTVLTCVNLSGMHKICGHHSPISYVSQRLSLTKGSGSTWEWKHVCVCLWSVRRPKLPLTLPSPLWQTEQRERESGMLRNSLVLFLIGHGEIVLISWISVLMIQWI